MGRKICQRRFRSVNRPVIRARYSRTVTAFAPLWIELEGADNVRDVGGLPTVDGATVRPGRLIRSDNLQMLTESAEAADYASERWAATRTPRSRSTTSTA